MKDSILIARTDQEILDCFPVMRELRPHLKRDEFVMKVRELERNAGFRLAFLSNDAVMAVAGFRISEWLSGGRISKLKIWSRQPPNDPKDTAESFSTGCSRMPENSSADRSNSSRTWSDSTRIDSTCVKG